jgi:hypothetical protein
LPEFQNRGQHRYERIGKNGIGSLLPKQRIRSLLYADKIHLVPPWFSRIMPYDWNIINIIFVVLVSIIPIF